MACPSAHLDRPRNDDANQGHKGAAGILHRDENAILWLRTCKAHLRLAFDVVEAWDFEYKSLLTWVKDRMVERRMKNRIACSTSSSFQSRRPLTCNQRED